MHPPFDLPEKLLRGNRKDTCPWTTRIVMRRPANSLDNFVFKRLEVSQVSLRPLPFSGQIRDCQSRCPEPFHR